MRKLYLSEETLRWAMEVNEFPADLIPPLSFPADWQIQIIPPFALAGARFWVSKPGSRTISVYLDIIDALGCVGEPYYEIYPDAEGTNSRFLLNETAELLSAIEAALAANTEKDE